MAEMTRVEAYKVLERMWSETFSAEEAEALHIAQRDIEFVDLIPADVVSVVRCKDCCSLIYVDNTPYCTEWGRNTDEDGYCHKG